MADKKICLSPEEGEGQGQEKVIVQKNMELQRENVLKPNFSFYRKFYAGIVNLAFSKTL